MRRSQLFLRPATKPSLQALAQAPTRQAPAAVFFSNHHIDVGDVVPLPLQRRSLNPACLSKQRNKNTDVADRASWAFSAADRHGLLLSGSANGNGDPYEPQKESNGISDHEYQTRVGKACRVIIDSLPDFMHKGVVDLQDIEPDCTSSSRRAKPSWNPKALLPSLSPFLGQSLLRRKGKERTTDGSASRDHPPFDSLYHPSIAFEFRPPLPHISIGGSESSARDTTQGKRLESSSNASEENSLERHDEHSRYGPTICFNGRTMYVASSHLLRHALSALFHDTSLHLESARFEGRSKAGSSWPGISPYIKRSTPSSTGSDTNGSWPDKLIVRLRFEGISRVSSQPHTYTVIFKYEFDRKTGMIGRHVVDNIQPVPGSKVWAGLSHAWGNLAPAGAAGGGAAPPTACSSVEPKREDDQKSDDSHPVQFTQ